MLFPFQSAKNRAKCFLPSFRHYLHHSTNTTFWPSSIVSSSSLSKCYMASCLHSRGYKSSDEQKGIHRALRWPFSTIYSFCTVHYCVFNTQWICVQSSAHNAKFTGKLALLRRTRFTKFHFRYHHYLFWCLAEGLVHQHTRQIFHRLYCWNEAKEQSNWSQIWRLGTHKDGSILAGNNSFISFWIGFLINYKC